MKLTLSLIALALTAANARAADPVVTKTAAGVQVVCPVGGTYTIVGSPSDETVKQIVAYYASGQKGLVGAPAPAAGSCCGGSCPAGGCSAAGQCGQGGCCGPQGCGPQAFRGGYGGPGVASFPQGGYSQPGAFGGCGPQGCAPQGFGGFQGGYGGPPQGGCANGQCGAQRGPFRRLLNR